MRVVGVKGRKRSFKQASGDHTPFHATLAISTCPADAALTDIAIIHSRPGTKVKSKRGGVAAFGPNASELAYLTKYPDVVHERPFPADKEVHRNENMYVSVSTSGSQTKGTFQGWARHFVGVCKRQGPLSAQHPRILYIDGHSSRWTFDALQYLKEHHIHVFAIPR